MRVCIIAEENTALKVCSLWFLVYRYSLFIFIQEPLDCINKKYIL